MIDAASYFAAKLAYETDASDVYAAQRAGEDVILLDVRSDEAWRHVEDAERRDGVSY